MSAVPDDRREVNANPKDGLRSIGDFRYAEWLLHRMKE
jgi:hypothetical protein